MYYNETHNIYVGIGGAFSLNGVSYPPNWVESATEEEIAALGFVPVVTIGERGDDRYFDNAETTVGALCTITATPKDLGTLRAIQWEAIKAERDRLRFNGGVKVGAHWFLTTAIATSEYNSILLMSVGLPDTTILRSGWRTMDGAVVDMTPSLARQILSAGFARLVAIDDAAQAHKAALEASNAPIDYDFSTGWPAVFGE